jgi:ProP effector
MQSTQESPTTGPTLDVVADATQAHDAPANPTAIADAAAAQAPGPAATAELAPAPDAAVLDAAAAIAPLPDLSPAACAARLAELFPAVFTPGQPQPLKLRIQADIQERAPGIFTRKALSAFLHRHTTSTAYLRTLVSHPNRIDLAGQAAGEVAAEHREAAALELQRRRDLFEARRAAERNAQREAQRNAQRAAPGQARPAQAESGETIAAGAVQADAGQARTAQGAHPESAEPVATRHPPPARHDARRQPPRGDAHRVQTPSGDARRAPAARGELRRDGVVPQNRRSPPRPDDARRMQSAPAAHAARPAQAAQAPASASPIAPAQTPLDPQRRDRQALLRAFEATTLTKRNFCALKGISEAELDAQLALARQDAAPAPPAREKSPQSAPRRAATPEPSANRS